MTLAANAEAEYIKYVSTMYPFIIDQNISTDSSHGKCNVLPKRTRTRLTEKEVKIRMTLISIRIAPIAGTYHGMDA